MKTLSILFSLLAGLTFNRVNAAPGYLDQAFGNAGKVTTVIGSGNNDPKTSATLMGDGRIVVAGSAWNGSNDDFVVSRYNTNGSLDSSFNGTGIVTTALGSVDDRGYSVVVQNDGKIIAAGWFDSARNPDFALVRYNTDGSLDTTFNGSGKVTTDLATGSDVHSYDVGNSVVLQGDGRIVVAGKTQVGSGPSKFALVRYNANGSLDTAFNGTGKVITAIGGNDAVANSVAVQSDGKIVAAGYSNNGSDYDFEMVRYNANGSLDTTFNGTGMVATAIGSGNDRGSSVAIQNDGKIVVAGTSWSGNSMFALVRYNADGTLDTSFNGTGKVTTAINTNNSSCESVAVQNDGKIVAVGSAYVGSWNFALVRYNADGTPDTGVNDTGKVITDIGGDNDGGYSVALQANGRIVVAGHSTNGSDAKFALVRYEIAPDTDQDGIPDQYETGTGIYVSETDTGTNPLVADTDGDGLKDGAEIYMYHSNPNVADTDGDGFSDGFEVNTGFNPVSAASTPDALSTLRPAREFRFNAADGSSYRIEGSTDTQNWTTLETNIIGTGTAVTRFYVEEELGPRYFLRVRKN